MVPAGGRFTGTSPACRTAEGYGYDPAHRGITPDMSAIKAGARVTAVLLIAIGFGLAIGAIKPAQLLVPGYHGSGKVLVRQDFGRAQVGETWPYDGQQVYLAARELPDLKAAGRYVDSPRYRLLRVLLPALASVGGRGAPVVLLLFFWNAVGLGIGVAGLTDLATRHGRPPAAGIAVAVALAFPLFISTTEGLAFGLGFAGLALVDRRRWWPAIACLALAALSRETALTFAVAAGGAAWLAGHRRQAMLVALVPCLPLFGWWLVVRANVQRGPSTPVSVLGFFHGRPPLSSTDLVITAVFVAAGVLALVTWRDVPVAWLTAAGFLAWFVLYEHDTFDSWALPRVSAPLLALGLAGLMSRRGGRSAGAPPLSQGTRAASGT